jgi:hypothetical protein
MMIDPYDSDNRRRGTVLISNSTFGGVEHYVAFYRDMVLNERDPIVKAAAIRALARHGQPDDAIRIVPHLTHENMQVRWEAAKGLQRLHNAVAVPDLLKVLRNEDEHPDVRVAAAVALGQYPEDRVFQGLVAALDARELAINLAAEHSLATLTEKTLGPDAVNWFAWYNSVQPRSSAFDQRLDYFYPTYVRDETFLEKLAFWSPKIFEQPASPSGLRSKSERSTYGDEEQTPPDTGS